MAAQPVAVVSDTTSYLPPQLVEEAEVRLVSLYVNWEDGSQREADMPNFDAFYTRLRTADQLPTTSQPSIGDFLEVYEPLIEEGRDIVSIHIAGGISGTVDAARQAAESIAENGAPDRITVIDSESACGGLGLITIAAARAALSGAGARVVAERAHDTSRWMKMWFAVDTLEYLRKGGRIGAAQAWVGSALKIKPILTFEQEVTPIERVRTGARARARLTAYIDQHRKDGADVWVVQHIQAPDEAASLVSEVEKIMGRPPMWVSEIGPVIGTHAGPGLLGVGGVAASMLEDQPAG
jgi:fatty acid kinase fatty acid binding subunit